MARRFFPERLRRPVLGKVLFSHPEGGALPEFKASAAIQRCDIRLTDDPNLIYVVLPDRE